MLLLCLKLRMCSQKSTKKLVEVMKEPLLAIYYRQEFPSILVASPSQGSLFLCVYRSNFVHREGVVVKGFSDSELVVAN